MILVTHCQLLDIQTSEDDNKPQPATRQQHFYQLLR
jgi:hypothetical protein